VYLGVFVSLCLIIGAGALVGAHPEWPGVAGDTVALAGIVWFVGGNLVILLVALRCPTCGTRQKALWPWDERCPWCGTRLL
jgi:hypothetical protein